MASHVRLTVRARLTIVYALLFLTAGAVLLTLNYALVQRGLDREGLGVRFIAPAPPGISPAIPPDQIYISRGPEPVDAQGRPFSEIIREVRGELRDRALADLLRNSIWALGAVGVVSAGAGWLLAGRALRPVHEITAAARRLSGENLHERLNLEGPNDELRELADTFDQMLARLDAAFDSQRRFVANASHEMRTPLSIIRTEIDVTLGDPEATPAQLRQMGETARDASVRAERLIDALLVLARSDRGLATTDPIDLVTVVERTVRATEHDGVEITTELEPASVRGDPALIDRLVGNLIDNAVRHNRAGGWVKVSTATDDDKVVVTVANSGAEIAADDVERLFEPFVRGGTERTGSAKSTGLGLSIIRSVALAHGGTATARALDAGGLEVTVTIPAG